MWGESRMVYKIGYQGHLGCGSSTIITILQWMMPL